MTTFSQAVRSLPALGRRKVEFEAWLDERAPRALWPELNLADLGLCFLALEHDASALAEVERRITRVAGPIAGKKGDHDFLQEVLQRVRHRLLVGSRPRLAAYSGRGSLVQYLKAVVLSVTVDLTRGTTARKETDDADDALASAASGEEGAETGLMRRVQRRHFTEAFRAALATLTPEERTWLRMRFVEGLSIDAVGAAFGVHRTTAMRWLEKAQKTLMTQTRKRLGERLQLEPRELDSLIRGLRPSLAENLSRLLPKPQ